MCNVQNADTLQSLKIGQNSIGLMVNSADR